MGLRVFQQTFGAGDFEFRYWQSWWNGGRDLLRSSIAMFGWMTLPLPNGFFAIAGAGLVVAGLGLLASIGSGIWQGRGRVALVTLVACGGVLAWTAAFAVTTGAVAWQGRFLFPAAPALGLLLAVGLVSALPRRAGLVAFTTVGLLLGTVLPFTFIRPIYQSPALAATEVPRGSIYDRFDFGWKRGFELQDATFARVVPTRSTMLVGLTWHLVEPVDRPWFVFLHLVDDQEQIVAKRDAQPLEGRIPTTAWVPGDWFRDEQHLVLTDVAPGAYHLRIGLWDPRTTRRLGVYDRDGQLRGDYVDLGAVTVTRK
jgi:hypothetical protein